MKRKQKQPTRDDRLAKAIERLADELKRQRLAAPMTPYIPPVQALRQSRRESYCLTRNDPVFPDGWGNIRGS